MNYWITTHWPPHVVDFPGPFYCGIWIQNGMEHVAAAIRPGDLVFKYESLTGPARMVDLPDGRRVTQACNRGHLGIVALMEVTTELYDERSTNPTIYVDGSEKAWRFRADAICKDSDGFVPLMNLNAILGYSPNNRLRGFGDYHSGLKRLDKATFDQIYTAFKNRS